ncbi:hypothetical protein BEP19_10370 [Ammoniphilus oxalaticus]|uniref:DUF1648 domain-containing protein n=1 Tax=Ammoniphilus oxalaticus TaxID=66863 RepID=A0A419SFU1_9BACL|nr:DUF1648 domain-containing protein [Ammoniphilus oxalaticus]RKD22654.1 hypothetical protein BEP19_10370 [Ammoniphilus oxalaticus]
MSDSSQRSSLDIPKTSVERIWDGLGYGMFICSIGLLILLWNKLPARVPAHFNALGEVDRWGGKGELLILPAIGLLLIISMQALEKFPQMHNYPERLNESNAAQFYLNSRKLVNQLKNICLIIFALILVESIWISLEWGKGFGKWFIPVFLIATLAPIGIALWERSKIK